MLLNEQFWWLVRSSKPALHKDLTYSRALATKRSKSPTVMTRFVLRNGEVFESERDPSDFDTFCYGHNQDEQTCHLLSFQSEIAFLMVLGDDLNLRYEPVQSTG